MDRILEEVATHLRVLEPYIRRTLLKIDSAFKDIENRLKGKFYISSYKLQCLLFFQFRPCSNKEKKNKNKSSLEFIFY